MCNQVLPKTIVMFQYFNIPLSSYYIYMPFITFEKKKKNTRRLRGVKSSLLSEQDMTAPDKKMADS